MLVYIRSLQKSTSKQDVEKGEKRVLADDLEKRVVTTANEDVEDFGEACVGMTYVDFAYIDEDSKEVKLQVKRLTLS